MRRIWLLVFLLLPGMLLAACSGEDEAQIVVGQDAPDFSLRTAAGSDVSLADYAGQPVLLYFHMAVG